MVKVVIFPIEKWSRGVRLAADLDALPESLVRTSQYKFHAPTNVGLIFSLALDKDCTHALTECRLTGGASAGKRINDTSGTLN
jgi:hypothetical protein